MKTLVSQIMLIVVIMSCQGQVTTPLSPVISFENDDSFTHIFFSEQKLFILSRGGMLSSVDLVNKKVYQILDLKDIGHNTVAPSSYFIYGDSVFLSYRNKIIYGRFFKISNFETIKNKGIIQGMVYKKDSLVLCYREKVKIVDLNGNTKDSTMINLDFVAQGIISPRVKFYLSSQSKLWVPYNNRNAKQISVDLENRLGKFNIKLYAADLYKDYIPKTVSDKCTYWQNVKEPHLLIVSSNVDFSKHVVVELDKSQINFQSMSPETIQLSEGDAGILDLENAVKFANDNNGTIFIMFQSKAHLTKILSFKLNEDEFK